MDKKAYFASDLHLGATYVESPRRHEAIAVRWLEEIAPTASEIYLLGDVLDYWYEYKSVVPRGYVRFFGALARVADAGVHITWLKGNHDIWIYDYLPSELGVEVADGIVVREILGKHFLMEHGDGCGEPRRSYRMMRSLFRNRICQRLFSAVHPGLTVPFAHRWSSHSRKSGTMPDASAVTSLPADDPLMQFSCRYLESHPEVDFFVYGHRHHLIDQPIGPHTRLIVLGEGFKNYNYGAFDGVSFSFHTMTRF